MPLHIIMHGIPMCIMLFIISQRDFIISICDMSIGIILHVMPSLVISQVILHIIGIMPMPIIGIIIGMPFIMLPIIGIMLPPIIGIMFIIGFIPIIGIMFIMGFMPIIGFIIGIEFIIGIPMFELFVGIAFIMLVAASYGAPRSAQVCARCALASLDAFLRASRGVSDHWLARRRMCPL